jgi:hypothetical protein
VKDKREVSFEDKVTQCDKKYPGCTTEAVIKDILRDLTSFFFAITPTFISFLKETRPH